MQAFVAERAGAIRGRERHHHQVTALDRADLRSDVLDDANRLVAHRLPRLARLHGGVRPQIAPADAGSGDAEDRVARIDDGWIGDILDADVAGGVHQSRSHVLSPFPAWGFFWCPLQESTDSWKLGDPAEGGTDRVSLAPRGTSRLFARSMRAARSGGA